MLQQAVARGYKDLERLKAADTFKPLRPLPDFQKLLKELEQKQDPSKR
jgi:hypothetical protein